MANYFNLIADAIDGAFKPVFGDMGIRPTITVQKRGVTSWDDENSQNVTSTVDYPSTCLMAKHTKHSVEYSRNASVQVGDKVYLIPWEDVPSLSLSDVIIHDGQTLDIKSFEPIPSVCYLVTVKGG